MNKKQSANTSITMACFNDGLVDLDSVLLNTGIEDDLEQEIDESDFTFSEPSSEMLKRLQEFENS